MRAEESDKDHLLVSGLGPPTGQPGASEADEVSTNENRNVSRFVEIRKEPALTATKVIVFSDFV